MKRRSPAIDALAEIVEPLARQGVEAGQEINLPEISDACHRALQALEDGSSSALVAALVAIGHYSREPEIDRLRKHRDALWWAWFDAYALARRRRGGRKPKFAPGTAAMALARFEAEDWPRDAAVARVAETGRSVPRTVRRALRRDAKPEDFGLLFRVEKDEEGRLIVTMGGSENS
jgi:hypothetical protein